MPEQPKTLDLFLRVMRELRRNYDVGAAELGLTMARARVLTTLSSVEGATQAELAHALGIEAPTLKRQIEGLEQLGFLERRPVPGDARKRALFLTDKARASGITRFVGAVRAELFDGIAPEDLRAFDRALTRMADNTARIGEKWQR